MARRFPADRAPGTPAPRRADALHRRRRSPLHRVPHRHHRQRPLDDLEARHRCHARVEDRIRAAKATGLRNLPCRGYAQNKVWLELSLAAADLLTWAQALCFTGHLARCEPAAFRYRVCAVAARLVRTGRSWQLRLDRDWPWARHLQDGYIRLRAAPWPA